MERLERILLRLDGKGYRAYKEIKGCYHFKELDLYIDHVQGDPFASPSKLRIRMDQKYSKIPVHLFHNPVRKMACEDFLTRRFQTQIRKAGTVVRGSGKSGSIEIDCGGQEVLQRTSMEINSNWVEARIEVGLPANGRRILGREAAYLLVDTLPSLANNALEMEMSERERFEEFIECVENQESIRDRLDTLGLCAFVANGSILPRISGHLDLPMRKGAIPFRSPVEMEICLEVPNPISRECREKRIRGMGIRRGVNLIVGGGYHGKSTLLQALERCVYPHIPGDGREYVITDCSAVKIRAEDGRRIEKVNISPFISNLPFGKDTQRFSSTDASGSTSQAANIIEAVEIGSKLLLMDEDTCATNFMIRDTRMQQLVASQDEPIKPFIDWVRELHEQLGISTTLVMGGCGDYLELADQVLFLKDYGVSMQTEKAREVCKIWKTGREREAAESFPRDLERIPSPDGVNPSRGRNEFKIQLLGLDRIIFGREEIDLRQVEQIVDPSQLRAIGYSIYALSKRMGKGRSLVELLEEWEKILDEKGLDNLSLFPGNGEHPGRFSKPRRFELAAALNRMRTLRFI